jgi:hypothetical protein
MLNTFAVTGSVNVVSGPYTGRIGISNTSVAHFYIRVMARLVMKCVTTRVLLMTIVIAVFVSILYGLTVCARLTVVRVEDFRASTLLLCDEADQFLLNFYMLGGACVVNAKCVSD